MAYKITISNHALQSLDHIVAYCWKNLGNAQAAISILDDATKTTERLSLIAGGLRRRDDLGKWDIYSIKFKKHKYLILCDFLSEDEVEILDFCHMSQNVKARIAKLK